ncbi:MAG TPA: tetratricopeptide repeat protein, partial [Terrimicrobiaceae bacterium]
AIVLQLHALLEASQEDEALKVIQEEFPRMSELLQLVTFQTLIFELGTRYLDRNQPREAIICLQRVWSATRLLEHQKTRLEDLESKLQAAEADPRGDAYTKLLYGQMIGKVKREIDHFRKIESFDASVRLRLAAAYQKMERYRESALIMEAMLTDMPADRIVESASINLVQSWSAIERWPKTTAAADIFAKKFPKSAQLPFVIYLKGLAEQKSGRYREAVKTFAALSTEHPSSDYAPRASFMEAFCLLQAEDYPEAIAKLGQFQEQHSRHELKQDALYWRGVSWSLDRKFGRCREVMDEYLRAYKSGPYRAAASFRKAYCAQQAKDYQTSIKELEIFLREYPEAQECNEARMLLGDALLNEGRMEEGIAAFRGIPKDDPKLYAEGTFRIGKAYKVAGEYENLRQQMTAFAADNSRNPRVAEAIYWIGWTYRQQGLPDKARDVYWKAIEEYGDDATIHSVEDLFPSLAKLYKADEEKLELSSRLRAMRIEAEQTKKTTLGLRVQWAEAVELKKRDPARAQESMVEVSKRLNVQTSNPLLLADCADSLLSLGMEKEAEALFRELLKWNPRAPQKDRALAA